MKLNLLFRLYLWLHSLPARLKGLQIGFDSYLSPGYDFFGVSFKGVSIGNHVRIGRQAVIGSVGGHGQIIIKDGTQIGRHVSLSSVKRITIGQKCLFSYNVSVLDHDHVVDNPNLSPIDSGITSGHPVTIGDHCFLGAHSFVLKGVSLGRHCVVAANSVVTKSFPDYSVVAGNPAKLIKTLK